MTARTFFRDVTSGAVALVRLVDYSDSRWLSIYERMNSFIASTRQSGQQALYSGPRPESRPGSRSPQRRFQHDSQHTTSTHQEVEQRAQWVCSCFNAGGSQSLHQISSHSSHSTYFFFVVAMHVRHVTLPHPAHMIAPATSSSNAQLSHQQPSHASQSK